MNIMKRKIFVVVIVLFCVILVGCNNKKNNIDNTMKKIDIDVIEPLLLAKKIVIEDARAKKIAKELTDTKDIDIILNMLSSGYEADEVVTTESSNWYLYLYDSEDKLISKIWLWKSGYFGFANDKEYTFFEKIQEFQDLIKDE